MPKPEHERKLDFQEIRRNREAKMTWKDIAAVYDMKVSTLRGIFSRWLATEEGQKAPGFQMPSPSWVGGECRVIMSRPNNTFLFGVAGDRHHASKYHRQDVLEDLHQRFERAGVDCVFDAGNWIDGESRFNKHDITRAGMDPQIHLMAEETPQIGVPTFAVWGDDHEGWYAQREGIDMGQHAEHIMQHAGHDWHDLGFMEAHIVLRNANTGAETIMAVSHPGGGSAYALSYRPQKIIESLEGGEKPAVVVMGHYHKLEALNVRNVWCLQSGTTCDQTPFLRKKSIEVHVGGAILGLEQDPESGAIIGFSPQIIRYFNRGFYNNRWSHSGTPNQPERVLVPQKPSK